MNFNCQTTCWDGTLGRDKAIVYRVSLHSLRKFNSGIIIVKLMRLPRFYFVKSRNDVIIMPELVFLINKVHYKNFIGITDKVKPTEFNTL